MPQNAAPVSRPPAARRSEDGHRAGKLSANDGRPALAPRRTRVVGGFAAAPEVEAEPLIEEEIVVVGAAGLGGRWIVEDADDLLQLVLRDPRVHRCRLNVRVGQNWTSPISKLFC